VTVPVSACTLTDDLRRLCPGRLAAKLRSIEEVFRAGEERQGLAHAMGEQRWQPLGDGG
jgi:hypothetical protein